MITTSRTEIETCVVSGVCYDADFARRVDASLITTDHLRRYAELAVALIDDTGEWCPHAMRVRWIEDGGRGDDVTLFHTDFAEVASIGERPWLDAERRLRRLAAAERLQRVKDTQGSRDPFDDVRAMRAALAEVEKLEPGGESHTLADLCQNDPADEPSRAVPTGLDWFDGAMPGGALELGDKLAIGGAPAAGKTDLALNVTLAALRHNPDLVAVWAAAEMPLRRMRNRALCRVSGLTEDQLRTPYDQLPEHAAAAKRAAVDVLRDVGRRLHFITAPVTPARCRAKVQDVGAQWLVADYLQILRPDGPTEGRRAAVDSVLFDLVSLSQVEDVVLVMLSDSPKPKSDTGKNPPALLDAFKESSEIAYAVDLAHYLMPDEDERDEGTGDVDVVVHALKARNGRALNFTARFEGRHHTFRGAGA